jgi:hypothetical protein
MKKLTVDPPTTLLMLHAYIDESGQEQQKDYMCIAGFAGTQEQWAKFRELWASAIAPRSNLRMANVRFNRDSERLMLERAGSVPKMCGLTEVFGAVKVADYADLVVGDLEDEMVFKGYLACCMPLLTNLLRGIPDDERVEVVFERQCAYGPALALVLEMILANADKSSVALSYWSKLAKWSFIPQGSPLLEASDYLCYALTETHRDPESTKAKWCRPILVNGNGHNFSRQWPRAIVRRMVRRALEWNEVGILARVEL